MKKLPDGSIYPEIYVPGNRGVGRKEKRPLGAGAAPQLKYFLKFLVTGMDLLHEHRSFFILTC